MSTMTTLFQSIRPQALTPDLPAAEAEFQTAPELDAKADNDRALLKRYAETGSGDAFAEIVYRHSGWVFHTCRRSLHDVQLAEDATQAVFLLLSRKVLSISPQTHVAGWLYQACRYVLIDIRKHQARYRRRQDVARDMALQRLTSSATAKPSLDPELAAALDGAIAGLSAGHRQTILMHFYEGLTLQQMANQLGITKEGAKKRVTRALSCLRAKLGSKAKGAIAVPVAALFLLLRTHGAEAAPPDIAAAVAKAATTPGVSSSLAEMMIEGVRQAMIGATDRLLIRLAVMVAKAALLAIVLLMALHSRHGGSTRSATRPPGRSVVAIGPTVSGNAKALAVLPGQVALATFDPPESAQSETHEQPADPEPVVADQNSKELPKAGIAVADRPADQRGLSSAPLAAPQTRTAGKTELVIAGMALTQLRPTNSTTVFRHSFDVATPTLIADPRRPSAPPPPDRDTDHHHDAEPPDDHSRPPHSPPPNDFGFEANAHHIGYPEPNRSHPPLFSDGLPALVAAIGDPKHGPVVSVQFFDSQQHGLHFNPMELANRQAPGLADLDGWENRPADPLIAKAWPVGLTLKSSFAGHDGSHDATGLALSEEKWFALNQQNCPDGQFITELALGKSWEALPELHATIVPEPSTTIWAIAACTLALRRRVR
jgi:RNA polymerase sigma factor (sigma-70 family)